MASPDVLLGAGLYETVRVSDGVALHGERHLERMTRLGARARAAGSGASAFARAIAGAGGAGDVVRVRLHAPDGEPELQRGARVRRSRPSRCERRSSAAGTRPATCCASTSSRAISTACRDAAWRRPAGYDDALLVTHDGRVGEATNANVALHVAGTSSITPSVDGLLPGVCRAALLEAARALGLAVEARPVALAELVDAEAVLLTSSPRGIGEAVELDGQRAAAHGRPDLLAALRERRGRGGAGRRAGATVSREPGSGCGRPRARGRRPGARHRAGGGAARAGGAGQRAARVGRGPLVVPRAVARRRALASRSGRRAGRGARTARPPGRRRAGRARRPSPAACSARSATTSPARWSRFRSSRATTSGCRPSSSRPSTRCTPSIASATSCGSWRAPSASCAGCARASSASAPSRGPPRRATSCAACRTPTTARASSACWTTSAAATCTRSTTRQRLEGNCASALDLYARLRESGAGAVQPLPGRGRLAARGRDARDFLRVDADGRCETRPIKGTRPRDDDPAATRRSPPTSRRTRRTAPRT